MKVVTAYEQVTILRLEGFGDFVPAVQRFDELDQPAAVDAYNRAVNRARFLVGREHTVTTNGDNETTAIVKEVIVELWQHKRGEGWMGSRRLVGRGDDEMRTIVTAPASAAPEGAPPDPTPRPGVSDGCEQSAEFRSVSAAEVVA